MVWKCRQQNNQMQACLKKVLVVVNIFGSWQYFLIFRFDDPEQYEKCKQEYLQEREEFKHTGISKKMKRV